MRKYVSLLFIIVANACCVSAQIAGTMPVNETLLVQANTNTLVTGETLYLKLYCLNATDFQQSTISKIAYVQLIDNKKKVIFNHKLALENGTGYADFFIPTTLKTGNYKLISFTRWMLNNSVFGFYETDIAIINPFEIPTIDFQNTPEKNKDIQNTAINFRDINVVCDKKTYGCREKVTLSINSKVNGNYTLSVRKNDGLQNKEGFKPMEFFQSVKNSKRVSTVDNRFLPELRGEIISGIITSKTAKDVNNKIMALSIPGNTFAFKLVETDSDGKFTFLLDKNPNASEVVIQVMDAERSDFILTLDPLPSPDLSELSFPAGFSLDNNNRNDIEQRAIASQIENAYYENKKDSLKVVENAVPFFNSLQKEYILDNYTRFPTLKETITEVLTEMNYHINNGNYNILLKNYYGEKNTYGPPLVLFNGLPIQDLNALFEMPAAEIAKVSLINEPYIYGPKTFGGIVNFTSKKNDFQIVPSGDFILKTEILRPLPKKSYASPNYESSNKYERIPDYRWQLLWIPEVMLNSTETALSFYTSDVQGTFEIRITGFTENGIPVSANTTFDVQN